MPGQIPFCPNGGLTLVPLPGFELVAQRLKALIETLASRANHMATFVDIATPKFQRYASGETFVILPNTHILEHDCIVLGSGPGTDRMIMELLWTLSMLNGRHAGRIAVMTGYFPLSRSDGDEGDTILTTPPMLMNMANAACGRAGLHRWVCADPHGKQISMAGQSGQVTPVYLTLKLMRFCVAEMNTKHGLDRPIVLAFPDDSAAKRFMSATTALEAELPIHLHAVTAFKRRTDSQNTQIIGIVGDVDEIAGARVLMFDDEIATGGSVVSMARSLKKTYGAFSIWACATHAVLCNGAQQTFLTQTDEAGDPWVDHLVVTDTIPMDGRGEPIDDLLERGFVSVYCWLEDLAWIIYRHHWNLGIRELR